jgi:hypothetical protein
MGAAPGVARVRRAGWIGLCLALAACNANPLLHEASADYAPLAVGDTWTYRGSGGQVLIRAVAATLSYQGRAAYKVQETLNAVPQADRYWSFNGGDWLQWDSSLSAWELYRRLPYVTGNTWPIASSDPTLTVDTIVDSVENLSLASGYYANCFKLRTVTQAYSGGVTTTTESDAWAAPGIGDVQYGQVDASGTASVLATITAYQVP